MCSSAEVAKQRAAEAAARYAANQHRYRAQTIARTELAYAYNAGAYGATKDAQAQGYIGDCLKVWLTAYNERVCPACAALDGEKRNMDEPFSNGKLLPPAHPQCRCTVAYEEIPGTNLNPLQQSSIMNAPNSNAQAQSQPQLQSQSSASAPTSQDPRIVVANLEQQYSALKYQYLQAKNSAFPVNQQLVSQLERELSRVNGELAKARFALLRQGSTIKVRFQSQKEAEEYCWNVLGIAADFNGVSVEAVNDWVQGIVDMQAVFPHVVNNNLHFVGECHKRNDIAEQIRYTELLIWIQGNNTYGFTQKQCEQWAQREAKNWIHQKLSIGSSMAQSWSPLSPYDVCRGITLNSRFFGNITTATQSMKYQVAIQWHPMSCDTTKSIFDHEFGHQLDDWLNISAQSDIKNIFGQMSAADIKSGLSEYGATSVREMIAEAWSEFCNNPTPRKIAMKVGESVEREYIEWAKKNF